MLRQGRLVDIKAGFQTMCRNYNIVGDSCDLSLPDVADGGFFQSNWCANVNQNCPFNEPMPGDLVQRIRGRITNMEIRRDAGESFLDMTVEDNLHYPTTSINENYPDKISYAMFDYENDVASFYNPDGRDYAPAWDLFLLKEAVVDICVKSGIDPTYLYAKRQRIQSDFSYTDGNDLVQGNEVRLGRPFRYGNAFMAGDEDDAQVDDAYLWKQDFGAPLIDILSSLADNYGYLLAADPYGNMVFSTRSNPTFKLAEDTDWSAGGGWNTQYDPKALGGAYLYANGSANDSVLGPVQGSSFQLYMGLLPDATPSSWHLLYNEGVLTDGWSHGNYLPSEVTQGVRAYQVDIFGVTEKWENVVAPNHTVFLKLMRGNEVWVSVRPQVTISAGIDAIILTLSNGTKSSSGYYELSVDVEVDTFANFDRTPAIDYTWARNVRFTGSPTKIVDDYVIDDAFNIGTKPTQFHIPCDTSYTLTAGTQFIFRFKTRIWRLDEPGGSRLGEVTLASQLSQINSTGSNFDLIEAHVNPAAGARVHEGVTPPGGDPILWDRIYFWDYFVDIPFHYNGNYGSPAWEEDISGNLPYYYSNIEFKDESAVPNSAFTVTVKDSSDTTTLWSQTFSNNAPGWATADGPIRFSTEGIDLRLGENPSVFDIPLGNIQNYLEDTYVRPAGEQYHIHVNGDAARIEGAGVFDDDVMTSKMVFSTDRTINSLNIEQSSAEIRNDIIVVGRLKGPLTDPNTGKDINPHNPTLDYVYSRAIDTLSIDDPYSENSLGKKSTFVIFEPAITSTDHADWLALSVLDRYRKVQNDVTMDALAVPYLDLDDAIFITDTSGSSASSSFRYWIESIEDNIESGKYEQSLGLTPLPPWPSFVPKPDVTDLSNYRDKTVDNQPQLVIDIKLTDELDEVRWDGVATKDNYDPYESEGASLDYNVAKINKLKVSFNLLVNAYVNIAVRSLTTNQVCAYLLGTGTRLGRDMLQEPLTAGAYDEFLWDGIDILGGSRDQNSIKDDEPDIVIDPDSDGVFPGIYCKDGDYYVEFNVTSVTPSHHTSPEGDNAKRIYTTLELPTQTPEGTALNNASYGRAFNADFHEQRWSLSLGQVSSVDIGTDPAIGSHGDKAPGTSKQILLFTTEDNDNPSDRDKQGLHAWLEEDSSVGAPGSAARQAMSNRGIRSLTTIDEAVAIIAPNEEEFWDELTNARAVSILDSFTFAQDTALIYHNNHRSLVAGMSGFLDGPVMTNDGETAEQYVQYNQPLYADQCIYNRCYVFSSKPTVKNLAVVDRRDRDFQPLKAGTSVILNPSNSFMRLRFNKVPPGMSQTLHTIIRAQRTRYRKSGGSAITDELGYKVHNMAYCARWFTIRWNAHDRSGRGVTVNSPASYDHRVGIGYVPEGYPASDSVKSAYQKEIIVRAYWIPVGAKDSEAHNGGFAPDEAWLDNSEDSNIAWQDIALPDWSSSETLPYNEPHSGDTIISHCIPCFVREGHVGDWIEHNWGTGGDRDNISVATWNSEFAPFLFFAWPIHHFWATSGADKEQWTDDVPDTYNAAWRGKLHENAFETEHRVE
jgi:hypothetical protein